MAVMVSTLSLFAFVVPSLGLAISGAGAATSFATSSDGLYNVTEYDPPELGSHDSSIAQTWELSVDDTPSGHKQSITGFGGMLLV
jgi:hypothetical protein